MAVQILEREITAAIKNYTDKGMRDELGKTEIHEVTITKESAVSAFKDGLNNIMIKAGYDPEYIAEINKLYNTDLEWGTALDSVFSTLDSFPSVETNHELKTIKELSTSKLTHVYLLKGSTANNMVVRVYAGEAKGGVMGSNVETFCGALRSACYNKWIEKLPDSDDKLSTLNLEKGNKGTMISGNYARGLFGQKSPFAHDEKSTVGKYGIGKILDDFKDNRDIQGALNVTGLKTTVTDLRQDLADSLGITFEEEEVVMPNGNIKITRVIRGEIRAQGKESSDWRNIKKHLLGEDSGLAKVLKTQVAHMNPQEALNAEGSKSARKKIAERGAAQLTSEFKKRVGKKKKNVKVTVKGPLTKAGKPDMRFKANKKKVKVKTKGLVTKKARPLPNHVKIVVGGSVLKRTTKKEKGKGKDTISLAKLKSTINRRLPAEVRRNMGYPALTNRSGTFSNSVELVNLKEGANTLIGEYTYTRTGGGTPPRTNQPGVYETFEGTGVYADRWPSGYNPKPLIAKSIRNLAQEHVQNKFVLRRV